MNKSRRIFIISGSAIGAFICAVLLFLVISRSGSGLNEKQASADYDIAGNDAGRVSWPVDSSVSENTGSQSAEQDEKAAERHNDNPDDEFISDNPLSETDDTGAGNAETGEIHDKEDLGSGEIKTDDSVLVADEAEQQDTDADEIRKQQEKSNSLPGQKTDESNDNVNNPETMENTEVTASEPENAAEQNNEYQSEDGPDNTGGEPEDTSYAVRFIDEMVERAVRQVIGKPDGEIKNTDLLDVVKLIIINENDGLILKSLDDIVQLPNLESLNIAVGYEFDMGALGRKTGLKELFLLYNEISDISVLSGLTNLEYLNLDTNYITSISALSGMVNLKELWLGHNNISDISAVSYLTELEILDLQENRISEINALSALNKLERLELYGNEISDISALSALAGLEYLGLGNNRISDISPLTNLANLKTLVLSGNPVSESQVEELKKALPNCDIIFEPEGFNE